MDNEDQVSIEAVAKAVHDLSEAVTGMKAGMVDKDTVAALEERVALAQNEAAEATNKLREGFAPADVLENAATAFRSARTPMERLSFLHGSHGDAPRTPKEIALVSGVDLDKLEAFHRASDELVLLSTALGVDPQDTRFYEEQFKPLRAAMDTATTAEGTEWKPTELSSNLIRRVELALRVPALFAEIDMPTQPYEIPGMAVSRVRGGTIAEQTADTGQTGFKKVTPGSRKVTMTAVKFAVEALVSKEAEEDLIIPVLPLIQDEIVFGLAYDLEDALVNGDTTGTHQDSDVTASDDPRKAWKGLRKLAADGSYRIDGSAAAKLTVAHLRANRKKMLKYGIAPDQVAHVMSMSAYIGLLDDSSVITLEKYGPQATIFNGELAKVDGSPIIVSPAVRQDLNATGVFDNVTTTKTEAITVNTAAFLRGSRRGVTVQVLRELYAEYDQDAILATCRRAFVTRFPIATEAIVALTYNVTT